jgi:hypothetical protein
MCLGSDNSGSPESAGFYTVQVQENQTHINAADNQICQPCPSGADCSAGNGLTIDSLHAQPGYWHPHAESKIFSACLKGHLGRNAESIAQKRCCPLNESTSISICKGLNVTKNTDAQCFTGYAGPLCLVCAKDYVSMNGNCLLCPGASFATAMLPMLFVTLILFFVVLLYLYCCTRRRKSTRRSTEIISNAKKVKRVQKVFGQIKILLSYFQILSSMPNILDVVPWPNLVLEFSMPFSFFNLDIVGIVSQKTCSVSVRFFDRFLLAMLLPLFCFVAVAAAYNSINACLRNEVAKVNLKEETSRVIILIVLMLFSGLTTKIFQIFRCKSIDGIDGEFLVQDYAVKCHQREHVEYTCLAIGFLCLYVIGIPLVIFVLMWRNRMHLHDETSSRHSIVKKALGGLYLQCK